MTYVEIELGFISPTGTSDEDFDDFLDSVMDELDEIGRHDVDLTASLTNRTAVFVGVAKNEDFDDVAQLMTDLRTALHVAKCNTADWPSAAHFHGVRTRNPDLSAAV